MRAKLRRTEQAWLSPTVVETSKQGDNQRLEAERFVVSSFKKMYGAEVNHFLPLLMSLRSDDGTLLGVLGLRAAQEERLFLERYLDRPVEQLLAAKINMPVDRSGLVEVGNLAVASAGGGRWLIAALTAYLHAARRKWVVFTIGPVLYNTFKRMGLALIDLGPASPSQLSPEERAAWGCYYDQKPRVMAGRIEEGYQILTQNVEVRTALTALWLHASEAGRIAA